MTTAVQTRSTVRPRGWWFDLLVVALFVALTLALVNGHLLKLDQDVATWVDGHRPAPLYWLARVLNYLGQGGQVLTPVALLLAGVLAWRRRSARPLLVFVAAFVLTFLTIGPLKVWFDRAAPNFQGPEKTVLFNPYASGFQALSYPSGHLANTLVWYGVIVMMLTALLGAALAPRARLAILVLPPVIVFCTTIYTGFHWLTDSVAGVLLGLVLARLMARVPWDTVPLPNLGGYSRRAGL